jgi:hypothetical protein
VTDDPNSVADAPTPEDVIVSQLVRTGCSRDAAEFDAPGYIAALAAAGYEVVPAGTADRLAADLAHMTAKAANARSDADALAARLALWQSNTEGAIADAGDLPGDLTAWSAIRRLTAQRDDLADRLAAAEADRDWAQARADEWRADCVREQMDRSAAEARLSALTDAIGDPERLTWGNPGSEYLRRIADAAAAVQPPDQKDPT